MRLCLCLSFSGSLRFVLRGKPGKQLQEIVISQVPGEIPSNFHKAISCRNACLLPLIYMNQPFRDSPPSICFFAPWKNSVLNTSSDSFPSKPTKKIHVPSSHRHGNPTAICSTLLGFWQAGSSTWTPPRSSPEAPELLEVIRLVLAVMEDAVQLKGRPADEQDTLS